MAGGLAIKNIEVRDTTEYHAAAKLFLKLNAECEKQKMEPTAVLAAAADYLYIVATEMGGEEILKGTMRWLERGMQQARAGELPKHMQQ